MLFNSYEYILAFLPLTFFIYFYLNAKRLTYAARGFLVFASLFFYSWWNPAYLPLILGSMLFNFLVGSSLGRATATPVFSRKSLLTIGVIANLGLLGWFKYSNFLVENLNLAFNAGITPINLVLPLAISFFTFQQIAYLVDSYRGLTREYDFLNYAVFVAFFPQLIAGPIVHHKEMMPQFASIRAKVINYPNIAAGLFIFTIGLFKKVVIADYFATIATPGFDEAVLLTFFEAWATTLSYTFQLYFDFSGYSDMAIGAALLFNIRLPFNFNSPYKATSIRDFWRRWHITLSRFLRDYIYIPLGGNRVSEFVTARNLLVTFLLGGIWHGAGWTFICWGLLHGAALVVQRGWEMTGLRLHTWLAWLTTFVFLNFTWVFFRARDWASAEKVLHGMVGGNGVVFSNEFLEIDSLQLLADKHPELFGTLMFGSTPWFMLLLALGIVLGLRNSQAYMQTFRPGWPVLVALAGVFFYTLLNMSKVSEFLYFNF